jgi:chaperonin cofactor prefoldin
MKISNIIIYSHDGQVRNVAFHLNGLNIITGRSSTGKSALSEIVEYCMGRSRFRVPAGTIRDKVAWYAVIYEFSGDQVLVAKPAPESGYTQCSQAMVRRGSNLPIPSFEELKVNSDDDSVIALLSTLVGIPENRTNVPLEHSRASFSATIRHTVYYLFQKQEIVANKNQLFYKQNEPQIPNVIRDTLPILLGVAPDDRFELESKLRIAKRDLKLIEKSIADAEEFNELLDTRGVGLLSEARQVGIVSFSDSPTDSQEILDLLKTAAGWKPQSIPDENPTLIAKLESEQTALRDERRAQQDRYDAARLFSEKGDGFSHEAGEQKDRLESIHALPRNLTTGEWQWPFSEENLGMDTPIANALLAEIQSLDSEMKSVMGERPQLDAFLDEVGKTIQNFNNQITEKSHEIAAAIAANQMIADLGNRNNAAAKIVGRISLFLETSREDVDSDEKDRRRESLKRRVAALISQIGDDNSEERLTSVLNSISTQIGTYVKELKAEFHEFPFRLDLKKLTVIADRGGRSTQMEDTGGGANHLAYHLGTLLALHHFATANNRPIPRFLFIDQPTQVYFPPEDMHKGDGSIERTESDSDLQSVQKLFELLYRFTTEDCPGFQLIVTEHANLRASWFQDSLVEEPWTKPPALVPDEWTDGDEKKKPS